MNPWLQRLLIGLAGGVVASGAVVSTAKQPHKLKKKKRKKAKDGTPAEPVQMGSTALKDARLPDERGLTVAEWKDAVVARGEKIAAFFKRDNNKGASNNASAADADGAPAADGASAVAGKEPDEVDGAPIRKKKKKKRRRGERRPQATLWDSAKESFKQTVKESVREEVKASPVGGALDALKSVGAKVKEGATSIAQGAQKAVNSAMDKVPAQQSEDAARDRDSADAGLTGDTPGQGTRKGALEDHIDEVKRAAPEPSEVARKVKSKLSDVGTFFEAAIETVRSSPNKNYGSTRVKPAAASGASGDDVVEAKDVVASPPASPPADPGDDGDDDADASPVMKGDSIVEQAEVGDAPDFDDAEGDGEGDGEDDKAAE